MKALVFHGVGDVRYEDVPDPQIEEPTDAIVRITETAICGTDLHMIRGTMPGMEPGTILGHEAVGVVEEVGRQVRNLQTGDRVVIPSSIGCGHCSYCRAGYFAQCDNANPNGRRAGTAFFGGPKSTGSFPGLQAERARIPYANVGLVRLPDEVDSDQALMLSDIFPTGYFGAELAEIDPGDTVAIFGCGPVGQFAIASAKLMGAGRVLAVDRVPSRLDLARAQGAECINFDEEDPVQVVLDLTGGIGVDRTIDAVGVDAEPAHGGPAEQQAQQQSQRFESETRQISVSGDGAGGDGWSPGGAPSQALTWAVDALAKAGTLSIIGVYPPTADFFPIGKAMNRNLTLKMGNCNHRKYIPELLGLVASGAFDPEMVLTQTETLGSAIEAYEAFNQRQPGWVKVELVPGM